jgi:hypothetical protein
VDWRAKVDLFEQLRREHEFGIGTITGVAAKFGVHRQALSGGKRLACHVWRREAGIGDIALL